MENLSKDISWLDKIIKRFKETGNLIPPLQEQTYRQIAREFVAGKTVVDVGCSIGIGSHILSQNARFVWGIDVNQEAINWATKAYKGNKLDFMLYDLENPPTREISKFEIVVMSEVIEHLTDPEVGLNAIKRFFQEGTIGFITAPNINNPEIKERDAANQLHLSHWTAGEFYQLLTKHFRSVVLYSAEKLDHWGQEETIDGDSQDQLIVAKVEGMI